FIRKPMVRDELIARLEGPTRIRRWAAKVLGAGASVDFDARSALTSIAAWTTAESTVCSELTDMLGFALCPAPSQDGLEGALHIGTLPLSLASEQAEISIAIGVDQPTATALAEAMLGSSEVEDAAI